MMSVELMSQEKKSQCPSCGELGVEFEDFDNIEERTGLYLSTFSHEDGKKHEVRKGGDLFTLLLSGKPKTRRKISPKTICLCGCGKEAVVVHMKENINKNKKERYTLSLGHDKNGKNIFHCSSKKYHQQIADIWNREAKL